MNKLEHTLPDDPMPLFGQWLEESWDNACVPNPNSMALASARVINGVAHTSSRIVLLKEVQADPGFLVFYTNYASRKGQELASNQRASAVIHWDKLGRQVRFEGVIVKSPEAESDAYFATRNRESQIGAWASDQSQPVASRDDLLSKLSFTQQRFEKAAVPRPPHWGGYRLWIDYLELWCNGEHRIHDRAAWQRTLDDASNPTSAGAWSVTRLQP